MAKRLIDTELWNNEDIIENFTAEDKYFWLYLLTSPHNNICGVMKASIVLIARDMGYSKETISNLLYRFENIHNVIRIDKETNELMILNWWRFNWSKSDKLLTSVEETMKSIKSQMIVDLLEERVDAIRKGIDRVSIGYAYPTISNTNTNYNNININIEESREKGEIKNKEEREKNGECKDTYILNNIIYYLNEKAGTKYRPVESNLKFIRARLKDYTEEDLKSVIDKKVAEWKGTDMQMYLRPETLFNATKFENYLNAPVKSREMSMWEKFEKVFEDEGNN